MRLAENQIEAINNARAGKAPPATPLPPPGARGMRHNPPPAPLGPLSKAALPKPAAPPAIVNAKAGTLAPLATRISPPPAKGTWAANPPAVKGGGAPIAAPVPPTVKKTRLIIFKSYVVSVLLCGLSSLTIEDKHLKKIDSWYFQFLRRAAGIKAPGDGDFIFLVAVEVTTFYEKMAWEVAPTQIYNDSWAVRKLFGYAHRRESDSHKREQDKKVQKLFKLIRHYRDLEDSPKKLKGVCKDQSLRYGKDTCEEEEEEEENPEEEECEEDEEVEIMECDEEQAAKPKQSHVVMKKPAARHAKAAPAERPIPTPCRRIAAKTSVADEEILFVGENKSSKQLELEFGYQASSYRSGQPRCGYLPDVHLAGANLIDYHADKQRATKAAIQAAKGRGKEKGTDGDTKKECCAKANGKGKGKNKSGKATAASESANESAKPRKQRGKKGQPAKEDVKEDSKVAAEPTKKKRGPKGRTAVEAKAEPKAAAGKSKRWIRNGCQICRREGFKPRGPIDIMKFLKGKPKRAPAVNLLLMWSVGC
ncbi:ATM1 [Symbiodinium microadriaticum]|nr:ATM1 [Symbiodinium microadriaticum]